MKDSTKEWILLGSTAVLMVVAIGISKAHAGEDWVEVHVGSKHSEPTYRDRGVDREFNETNLGLGYMRGINRHVEVGFGGYKNSYERTSLYTGADVHTDTRNHARLGVSVGWITGYYETDIMVLPNVTFSDQHVRVKFGFIPGKIKVVTVTAGFKF